MSAVRIAALVLALALPGCGGAENRLGANSAAGAVAALTSPDASAALEGLAAGAAGAAGKSAGDAVIEDVFGPAAQKGIADVGQHLHGEVVATATDPALLRQVAELREEAVGAPLRADIDKLIADATPRLAAAVTSAVQGALAPVDAAARADATRLRDVAIGLAVAAGALLAALAFAVWELRRHRALLGALLHRK